MPLPASLRIGIERSEKHAEALQRYRRDIHDAEIRAECEAEIGSVIVDLALHLDKAMNLIFSRYGSTKGGKPRIYFPMCATEDMFAERLQKDKLSALPSESPDLFNLLLDCQPFRMGEDGWWPRLSKIARKRHETFPVVNPGQPGGIGLGRGQDIELRNVSIDGSGKVTVGWASAWNRKTGKPESIKINFIEEIEASLEGVEVEPFEFLAKCAREVNNLVKKIGTHL